MKRDGEEQKQVILMMALPRFGVRCIENAFKKKGEK